MYSARFAVEYVNLLLAVIYDLQYESQTIIRDIIIM